MSILTGLFDSGGVEGFKDGGAGAGAGAGERGRRGGDAVKRETEREVLDGFAGIWQEFNVYGDFSRMQTV
jgi:hypothetical protein